MAIQQNSKQNIFGSDLFTVRGYLTCEALKTGRVETAVLRNTTLKLSWVPEEQAYRVVLRFIQIPKEVSWTYRSLTQARDRFREERALHGLVRL